MTFKSRIIVLLSTYYENATDQLRSKHFWNTLCWNRNYRVRRRDSILPIREKGRRRQSYWFKTCISEVWCHLGRRHLLSSKNLLSYVPDVDALIQIKPARQRHTQRAIYQDGGQSNASRRHKQHDEKHASAPSDSSLANDDWKEGVILALQHDRRRV